MLNSSLRCGGTSGFVSLHACCVRGSVHEDGHLQPQALRKWLLHSPWLPTWCSVASELPPQQGQTGLCHRCASLCSHWEARRNGSDEGRASGLMSTQHCHVSWSHLAFQPGAPSLYETPLSGFLQSPWSSRAESGAIRGSSHLLPTVDGRFLVVREEGASYAPAEFWAA